MKKMFCFLLVFVLLVTAAANTLAFANDNESNGESTDQTPAGGWTAEDIIQMSNYMNSNSYCRTGNWVLHSTVEGNGGRLLSYNSLSGESAIIDRDIPSYLSADGLWITYLCQANGNNAASIKRIYVTGGFEQTLIKQSDLPVNGSIRFLQIYDEHLYFAVTNENAKPITGTFFCADMNGENIRPVIEKAVYYPYIIDGQIYYQDDGDRCRIHTCNIDGSGDSVFIDDFCYQFISDGKAFYYDSYDGEVQFDDRGNITNINELTRVLKVYTPGKGMEVIRDIHPSTFAFNGEIILFSNALDNGRLYSYDLGTRTLAPLYLNDYLYNTVFVDQMHIFATDATSNYVERFVLANVDGSGISAVN